MTEAVPAMDLPPAPDVEAMDQARRTRLDRFRALLREHGLATGIVARPGLIRHFTGARVTVGALVVGPDDAWLAAPEGMVGADLAVSIGIRLVSARVYDRDAFVDPVTAVSSITSSELARGRPARPIGVELAHLPAAVAAALDEPPTDIGPLLDDDRRHKDDVEVDCLRRAVAVVERALAEAALVSSPGATERDIFRSLSESIFRDVGDDAQLAANISSGERTALDDPHATARLLRPGDIILLDVYPVVAGYVADLTRTWVVGEASPATRERHHALAAALAAGASALGEGSTAADVDRSVRKALADRLGGALAESMRHHTGHGIGVSGWERPWLGAQSTDAIVAGSVVCIEPGVYEQGVGGLRLEGEFLVTGSGIERLDRFTDELLELSA